MMLMMMYRQRLPKGLPSNTFSGARCAAAAVNATNGLTSPPHTFTFGNILLHFWSFGTPLVTEVRLRSHNHQKSLIHQSFNVYEYIIYPIFLLDIRFSIVFILDLKAWSKHRFDVKRHRMRGMWPYFSNMYSSSSKICGPTSQICPGSQILCRCLDYF